MGGWRIIRLVLPSFQFDSRSDYSGCYALSGLGQKQGSGGRTLNKMGSSEWICGKNRVW